MAFLQGQLARLGLYRGALNGVFDGATQAAVREFQRSRGLPPDGMVGPLTWKALEQALRPAVGSAAPSRCDALVIDLTTRTMYVFSGQKVWRKYPVAVGKPETPTPVGTWKVVRKAEGWGDGFGTRWIGLNVPWGIYGIHGTNKPWSIGSAASHGCIRMYNPDVEQVYPLVEPGTPVYVVGNPLGPPGTYRVLRPGDNGADVREVQRMLAHLGYYGGRCDGIFGPDTRAAVLAYRKARGLSHDDVLDMALYRELGLAPPG
ncbi:MAG: peptidoglycan-binding protein [Firmicutes bacterium]|nr:peptidoglycan-binding protein [Bacillota bacterium]